MQLGGGWLLFLLTFPIAYPAMYNWERTPRSAWQEAGTETLTGYVQQSPQHLLLPAHRQ